MINERTRLNSLIVGYAITLMGLLVVTGWALDIVILKSIVPGFPTMKLNNAICFTLLGISFLFLHFKNNYALVSQLLAAIVFIIALITISQDIFDYSSGIDELFVRDEFARVTGLAIPGRMATTSSLCFILVSTSFVFIKSKYRSLRFFSQQLLQVCVGISAIAILGYLYSIPALYKLAFLSSMALHTSIGFLVLSVAAIFVNPSLGVIRLFIGSRIGNVMARKLFPIMVIMIFLLGFFGEAAYQNDFVSVDFGIALLVISFLLVVLFLISRTAISLNEIDRKRTEAELRVMEMNKSLESKVATRTKELKESLEQLELLSDRFKIAASGAKVGIWDFDVVNNVLVWDDTMYQLYGVDKEKFSGVFEAWQAAVHPDDAEQANAAVQTALETGNELNLEFRVVRNDGTVKYITGRGVVKSDGEGNPIRLTGANWDVTELKEAELALMESTHRSKVFVDQAPSAIAMFDTEMRYIAASNEWKKDYKLEGREIIGKSHYDIFPEIGDEWKAIHRECLSGKISKHDGAYFEREDGSVQWIKWEVRPWYLSENKIGGLLMYTADISEVKLREQEKKRMEEVIEETTRVAKIGAWEVDLVKNKVIWSPMTKKIHEAPLDYAPDMETGINFYKEGESRQKITDAVNQAITEGKSFDLELQIVTLKGSVIWVRTMGQPEFKGDKCLRLYGIFQDINQRKLEQIELRNSELQFRDAFEYSAIGMALVSTEGKWINVNPQIPKMLGYSKEELLEKTFQDITHPDDLEADLLLVERVLRGELNTYQLEKRYFHKNGSVVWVLLSVSLLRDVSGAPVHFISQMEDITIRKKVEDELTELNHQMSAIFESGTQVSIIRTDTNGLITYFSKGSETLLGYKSKEMVGVHSPAVVHVKEEIVSRGEELSQQLGKKVEGFDVFVEIPRMKKFESKEWTYVHKDGTTFPVQLVVTAVRNEQGEITGYLGIATDITEQKESEEKFKALLESAPDAMVIVNEQGKIVIVNSQTIKLFGYSKEELEGQTVELLIPPKFKHHHHKHRDGYFANPMTRPMGEGLELAGMRKDGHEFAIEISLSPIETAEGKLVSAAIRDVTERKAAQRSLEEMAQDLTNRNKQLASFAHITSHNLRAPVSNLNSLLAIYNSLDTQEERDEIFVRFEKVINHLSSTLNELIEALKIKENTDTDREVISFEEVFNKTKEIMMGQIIETSAVVESDFEKAPSIVYNRGYLESIIQNLMGNAIKYRSPERKPKVVIRTFQNNNETYLTISDNGLGINLERHGGKIFGLHKTFHRHAEAKGVGLFITKTQVEAMGGKISVESEVGKGSVFKINFGKNNG
ncbi:MAG: PAS domain S-box protein [Cyclobacteriaceae bacterium]